MKLSRFLLVGTELTGSLLAVPTASAAGGWQVDLAEPGADSTNVATGPIRLAPGPALNVRSAPHSRLPNVGLAKHAQVRIECVVAGELVTGSQGTTNRWYRLARGMFVSAAYVAPGGTAAPTC